MTQAEALQSKREFVKSLAIELNQARKTKQELFEPMSIKEFAERLNSAGHRTRGGEIFTGDRGTHRLLEAVYRWLDQNNETATASLLWQVFERPRNTK